MALLDVTKVRLYSHSSCTKEVLEFLQERAAFERIEKNSSIGGTKSEYAKADLDFAIRFLSSYAKKRGGLRGAFLGDKIEMSEGEAKRLISACDWKGVVKAVGEAEVEKNDLTRSLGDISAELQLLDGWEEIEVLKSERFSASFFRVHQKNSTEFENRVEKITPLIDVSLVSINGVEVYYSVIASKEDMATVLLLVQELKGDIVPLPIGKVQDRIIELKKEQKAKKAKLSENEEKIRSYVSEIDGLKALYDHFDSAQEVESSMAVSQDISSLSVLEGWMIEQDLDSLKSEMEERWKGVEIERIDLEEGEKKPVHLSNKSAVRPFAIVTNMYGAPQSNEIDPTPFLSLFFVIFFGLCLTDAAYGLILTVAMAFILLARMPIDQGMKDMFKLLLYAGVSTVFFGVLFGGWFGIDPSADFIPEFLTYINASGEEMFLGQVVNPAKDLVTKIAPPVLLLGVLHLLLGVVLSGYVSFKNNNKWDAFVVALPTFITISTGILMALVASGVLPESISLILKNILIAGFVVMTIGIMKSGGPIQWFMGVTGWLSNTLSYARLFALGLATGVVAQVFNTVAFTIGGMMPTGLDIIVIIAIILFGHTLNIALNLLGAFVHSGRLQFVEFFGQFLEGGGRYFSPIKKSTRYIYTT